MCTTLENLFDKAPANGQKRTKKTSPQAKCHRTSFPLTSRASCDAKKASCDADKASCDVKKASCDAKKASCDAKKT